MLFTKYAKIIDPTGKEYPVKNELTIGRAKSCGIFVPENYSDVKDVHATIGRVNNSYFLTAEHDAPVFIYRTEGSRFGDKIRDKMLQEGYQKEVEEAEAAGWKLLTPRTRVVGAAFPLLSCKLDKPHRFRLGKDYEFRFEI